MFKKFFQILAGLIILALLIIASLPKAYASTIDEKRQQIKDLQNQISANQQDLKSISKEAADLTTQVAMMDGQIKDTELQISLTEAEIEQTQAQINELVGQIRQKEAELAVQKNNLAESMRVVYENPQESTIEIVVGANSLTDIVNRTQYMEAIQSQIEGTVQKISDLKTDLENKRKDQEKKKAELGDLLKQQNDYHAGLVNQKAAKDALLSETKGQESNYQKMLSAQYADLDRANSELRRLEGGTIGVAGSYPVPYWPLHGYISAYFGACGCEAYFCGRCHTGIDIVAPPLTPIRPAKDGQVVSVVTGCQDFRGVTCGSGYGNNVRVLHADGYTSIYGHMSAGTVNVSVGDYVKAGATILGEEGSSGFSTGYHLHFEIRNPNNVPVGAALP